ncbi:hypothetical protein Vafri_8358 [Volvox africanus]|nr:hypothetical protein Vafri_8358 [Volvox africanus]
MPPLLIQGNCYLVCTLLDMNNHPPACAPVGTSLKLGFGPQDEYQASSPQTHLKQHQQSPQEVAIINSKKDSIKPAKEDAKVKRCQVDGCVADLSGLRPYFRRYHVCETHIRSQVVAIKNHEVRFCDQCSTFHPIAKFDGGRRTCRQKLEHNRQRRRTRRSQSARNELDAKKDATAACTLSSGGSTDAGDCNVTVRLATSQGCSAASAHGEDAQGMRLQVVDRTLAHATSNGPWRSGACPPPEQRWEAGASVHAVDAQGMRLQVVDRTLAHVTSNGPWRSGACPPPEQRWEAAASVHGEDAQGMRLQVVDRTLAHVTSNGPWRSGACPPPEQRWEAAASVHGEDAQGMRLQVVDRTLAHVTSNGPWRSGTCPSPEQRWEAAASVHGEDAQGMRLQVVDRTLAHVTSNGPWRSGTCPSPEQRREAAASVHGEDAQGMRLQLVDRTLAHVTSNGPWRSGVYQPAKGVCSSTGCLHLVNAVSTPVTSSVRWPNGFSHVDAI